MRFATAGKWFVAGVWLVQGLYSKLLTGVPRHLAIVRSVPYLGEHAHVVLPLVGVAEVALAIWILSGVAPICCAATQTVALLSMNVIELTWAREHLLCSAALIPVNLAFLALAWTAAAAAAAYALKRHPFPVVAHFDNCLVLTYAFPAHGLAPLVPPGLTLDTYDGYGFVAAAFVQTRGLRPAGFPRRVGRDFFLAGYRVFVKFRRPDGRTVRGLRILRSDADRRLMVAAGNLLTHYNYRKCDATLRASDRGIDIIARTRGDEADVEVVADLTGSATLPPGSPFTDVRAARRFAGPLPFTFDYEPQTHSIVAIRGVRANWQPRPVHVDVRRMSFFDGPQFAGFPRPILAAAFAVRDIDYRWERGVRHALGPAPAGRFDGVRQILRFNWTHYAAAAGAIMVGLVAAVVFTGARPLLLAAAACAAYWPLASLIVSHWVYDRSPLRRWTWIADALRGRPPARWISLHAGVDEATPALRRMFAGADGRVFDIFDPGEMTEPSIARARHLSSAAEPSERADWRNVPVADESVDAAMLLLAAHELRTHGARATLFAEVRRTLRPGGRIVLAEHLRDAANFLAFGPGFLHFHSRVAWLAAAREAGLEVEREFRITPFVAVFVFTSPAATLPATLPAASPPAPSVPPRSSSGPGRSAAQGPTGAPPSSPASPPGVAAPPGVGLAATR
jgi:SAM-dependent methyltransferase